RDILFLDEIHRLRPALEEFLYPAMEEFHVDVRIADGPHAQTIPMALERFTLIGATTRFGLLTPPMRARFGLVERLSYYPPDDLATILTRSAGILAVPADAAGITEIARRSRGTPRVANRLLKRVRDYAQVRAGGKITAQVAAEALKRLDVDEFGLDDMDGRILKTIIEQFEGGPVGLTTIAAAVGEDPGTLEEVYEPFLMQRGFLARTPRGRCATGAAYKHFGFTPPRTADQQTIFDGKRETGTVAELLVVRELPDGSWLAMGHPGGKLKPGRTVRFGDDSAAEIVEMLGGGLRRVKFVGALDARATLAKYGETPLPPYIRRAPVPEDRARYQTVYAAHDGSVAAPTAGLHFKAELVDRVRAGGAAVAMLGLHVG